MNNTDLRIIYVVVKNKGGNETVSALLSFSYYGLNGTGKGPIPEAEAVTDPIWLL